jgi:hypothetical protein
MSFIQWLHRVLFSPIGNSSSQYELKTPSKEDNLYPHTRIRSKAEHIEFMKENFIKYAVEYQDKDGAFRSIYSDIRKHARTNEDKQLWEQIALAESSKHNLGLCVAIIKGLE